MERPSVPPSSDAGFRVRLRTRWSDEDTQAALNNAVYLTLFEEARYAFFTELGQIEANRFPFVLAQTNVVYLATGRGGREVDVEVTTTYVGTTSFTQAYRVRDASDGAVWCEAEARLVAVNAETGRKTAMSEAFRHALAQASS